MSESRRRARRRMLTSGFRLFLRPEAFSPKNKDTESFVLNDPSGRVSRSTKESVSATMPCAAFSSTASLCPRLLGRREREGERCQNREGEREGGC